MTWNRQEIFDLLLEAGEIALRVREDPRPEKKADLSIVTRADRDIEALLTSRLEAPERGIRIIGEETVGERGEDYIASALAEDCFVIDPIDGTSPYAHGLPNWGVSIGFMRRGRLEEGAVYLPQFGEVVATEGSAVLEAKFRRGEWSWRELERDLPSDSEHGLIGITQRVAKRGRALVRNPVQVLGAAVVPLVGLVQRRFIAYLGSVKLWDIAGSLPLILRHEFAVSVRQGDEIRRVTNEVSNEVYHLDPRSSRRWSLRSDLLISRPEDEERLRAAFTETDAGTSKEDRCHD